MDDPLFMRRLQGLGDLPGDRERFIERNRSARDPRVQAFPFHELHDENVPPVHRLERVDRRDAGMVQCREGLRLPLEPRDPIPVLEELLRQDFQRDVAVELAVPRPVHLAHPARAQRRENFIGTEPTTDGDRHLNSQVTRSCLGSIRRAGAS